MKLMKRKLLAVLLVLTTVFSMSIVTKRYQPMNVYATSNIPADALEYNGHYYYVYDMNYGWDEAKAYCESLGGYLATITSQEENDVVYQYLRDQGYESAYFGYTDEEEEGVWKWVTGEKSTYSNWSSGEPNGENPNEDYAMFYYKYTTGQWNDGDFGNSTVGRDTTFICEWGDYEQYTPTFDYVNDTWSFENPTSRIPVSAYGMFFEKSEAKSIQKAYNGTKGHCAGMVLSTMASFLGFPKANSYGNYTNLNQIKKTMRSDVTLCKAIDYINYAFAYQFAPKCAMAKELTNEDYDGIYNAVKDFEENGGEPVYISIGGEEGGHALMGLSIAEETPDCTKILVYDCNYPNKKCYLTLNGEKGRFNGWSYDLSSKINWNNSSKESRIAYIRMASDFISDYKVGYAKEKNASLLMKIKKGISGIFSYSGDNIYLDKLDDCDLDSVIPIKADTGENNSDNSMYWIDASEKPVEINDLEGNSTVSLAKGDLEISAINEGTSDISMNIDQKSVKIDGQKGSEFQIAYDVSKDYENSDISIIEGNMNKTATVKQMKDNVLVISGIKKIDVTSISKKDNSDGTSSSKEEQKVSINNADENAEYKIDKETNGSDKDIIISEDKNGDGVFETVVASTKSKKVKKINIKASSSKIAAGKKLKLTTVIVPQNATNKKLKWTTNNKKYATVNKNGVVTTNKKAGGKTVKITAQATDGSNKKATFTIKIMKGVVKKIKITGSKTVKAGKTLKLKTKITASKGANKILKWTSSNKKYATVSSSGKVKTLKAGKKKSVKITAMATDGSGKKATFTIKIK